MPSRTFRMAVALMLVLPSAADAAGHVSDAQLDTWLHEINFSKTYGPEHDAIIQRMVASYPDIKGRLIKDLKTKPGARPAHFARVRPDVALGDLLKPLARHLVKSHGPGRTQVAWAFSELAQTKKLSAKQAAYVGRAFVAALHRSYPDDSGQLDEAILRGYSNLGQQAAGSIPKMAAVLVKPETKPARQILIADAMRLLGPVAKAGAPALRSLLTSSDAKVVVAASQALDAMGIAPGVMSKPAYAKAADVEAAIADMNTQSSKAIPAARRLASLLPAAAPYLSWRLRESNRIGSFWPFFQERPDLVGTYFFDDLLWRLEQPQVMDWASDAATAIGGAQRSGKLSSAQVTRFFSACRQKLASSGDKHAMTLIGNLARILGRDFGPVAAPLLNSLKAAIAKVDTEKNLVQEAIDRIEGKVPSFTPAATTLGEKPSSLPLATSEPLDKPWRANGMTGLLGKRIPLYRLLETKHGWLVLDGASAFPPRQGPLASKAVTAKTTARSGTILPEWSKCQEAGQKVPTDARVTHFAVDAGWSIEVKQADGTAGTTGATQAVAVAFVADVAKPNQWIVIPDDAPITPQRSRYVKKPMRLEITEREAGSARNKSYYGVGRVRLVSAPRQEDWAALIEVDAVYGEGRRLRGWAYLPARRPGDFNIPSRCAAFWR